MRKIILLILFAIPVTNYVSAQPWMANIKPGSPRNFYAIKKAFDDYWQDKLPVKDSDEDKKEVESPEDDSYVQFERWANFMEPRVFPTGNFFDPDILQNEHEKFVKRPSPRSTEGKLPAWSFIGPAVVPQGGGDAGRVNCISISPKDTSSIFVGAASGGLWVTHDGGKTWSTTTDLLPAICIADIAINPNNPDTMYVATGDGYGYLVPDGNINAFWGGTYSAGVMKSTDGGLTWNTTGLKYTDDSLNIINRLLINPKNPNILLAATHGGIYRTANAGVNWQKVDTGTVFDLAFNMANSDTVYASSTRDIYKSINAGATWSAITSGLFPLSDRTTIATTPANTEVIYALNLVLTGQLFATGNLYKSIDGGKSFSRDTFPAGAEFFGYYDGVMSVSPTNANTLYCGGLELVKSNNGGISWTIADDVIYPSVAYVHVDKHAVTFYPNSNSEILCGNDGGLFKTFNSGNDWADLSKGLAIKQYYCMSSSSSNKDNIFAGSQDNGADNYNGSLWQQVLEGDVTQSLVDYTNDNTIYLSNENGALYKTTDGGNTLNYIAPLAGGGAWAAPCFLNPANHNTVYIGYYYVYRSYDGGNTWATLPSPLLSGGTSIVAMAMAPSDSNYIYAASYGDIIRTVDGGATWADITGTLPVNQNAITSIAVSYYDPQKLWITFSGYQGGNKVYVSKDGGNTWTNYSGTLPNIPVDCIAYQPGTKDVLYAGTDFGVFVRDSTLSDWVFYNTGLPNVIVNQLEVLPHDSLLRAATYGRGMWETPLYAASSGIASVKNSADGFNVFPNPSTGEFTIEINSKQSGDFSLTVINILGEKVLTTDKLGQSGRNQFDLDLSKQPKGVYFIQLDSGTQNSMKKITIND